MDQATKEKEKLSFARVMVEVGINDELPDSIAFCNEHGNRMEQKVEYEWRPIQCTQCKGFGHELEACRNKGGKKIWVKKGEVVKDKDGFQQIGIMIGWCPNAFNVDIKVVNSQFVHCWVQPKTGATGFECTFVYGFNDQQSRLGSHVRRTELTPMLECITECQITDVKATGRYYTWCNKQDGDKRVFSRIDRVLANQLWMDSYDNAEVHILPEGEYDHTPLLVCVYPDMSLKKPFRFCNYWCQHDSLLMIVKKEWETQISSCVMYRLLQNLKNIKLALRRMKTLGWDDAEIAVSKTKARLIEIQDAMHENPRDTSLSTAEKEAQSSYKQAQKMLHTKLQQQAKLSWLKCGDENSKVFYQAIKARRRHNRIHAIHDMNGRWLNKKEQVEEAFVNFYKSLFTNVEQKEAVMETIMKKGKMHCWEVIGDEVCEAVLDFFKTGKLLKVINVTTLTLIPKVKVHENKSSLVTRELLLLEEVFHNVLICQDLVKNYNRSKNRAGCMMKLDLKKAYDSVNWEFIQQMLEGVGFPRKFIDMIMGFQLFSHTSGLEVNKHKSEVYFTGMTQRDIQRVTDVSGFKVGKLPFTYLGVPISTSKLKAKDCQALIEKMLFIIPKSILKEINSICRCFLWSATHNDTKPGAVAWNKLCRYRKDSGLGFRDTGIWNMVALSKLAWGVAQKQDNLWVKWVHGVYIKESNWASYVAPSHASWAWKYVCQAKNLMNEKTNGVQWLINGQFSIKQYYQLPMRGNRQAVWARYVWNRYTLPKHRLIMWLAIQDRLKTRQRLKLMNVCVDDQCVLCQQHTKTMKHLLFECKFSELCLSEVLQWLGITWIQRGLMQHCRWILNRYKGNRTRKMVLLAALHHCLCNMEK
ncbi:uncharacterized protein LOC125498534 [Beta vulgaris subsp. vulgaris]|uniref:uncharacterized protein LOC125498534 n=1 Tax=Beta vulgaris subsp. vulgaris TaxID=3555 RepID=UPI002548A49F|nr:uncharacterized protein LOC125498534 [Beta vulgaris subsp. vulgaris]